MVGRATERQVEPGPAEVGRCARLLRSRRRRLVALAIVAATCGGVVVTHGALAMDHMGDEAGTCVAVLDAGLLASGVALLRRRARRVPSRHPAVLLRPVATAPAPALEIAARARAGPPVLQVFRS